MTDTMHHGYPALFRAFIWAGLILGMGVARSTNFIDRPFVQIEVEEEEAELTGRTSPFTETEKGDLVGWHNYFRGTVDPPASNMEYISWHPILEELAQRWADGCIWAHGTPEGVEGYYGQNLWAITANGDPSPKAVISPWAEELHFYNYTTNSCMPGKVCGHYTQMIWGATNSIGCGRTFCPILEGSGKNRWIVVCQYAPGGNIVGRQPYLSGPPCTKCSGGVGQCHQDLCRPCEDQNDECDCRQVCQNCGVVDSATCTCRCPQGYRGADCSEICQDLHPSCASNPGFPDPRFCNFHPIVPYMCPLMCGVCSAPLEEVTCEGTTTVATTGVKTTRVTEDISTDHSTTTGKVKTTPVAEPIPSDHVTATEIETTPAAPVAEGSGGDYAATIGVKIQLDAGESSSDHVAATEIKTTPIARSSPGEYLATTGVKTTRVVDDYDPLAIPEGYRDGAILE